MESNPARAEVVVKAILNALDKAYIECHAGGPDSTVHNHCLFSKDSMSVLHDPADKNDSSPSIPIRTRDCLEYILDKVTDNFSHGQVPWQCYHCGITIRQIQYHTNCLYCSTSVVDNAKLHLRQMLSLIQNIDLENFLKMPGYTPQRIASLSSSPHMLGT